MRPSPTLTEFFSQEITWDEARAAYAAYEELYSVRADYLPQIEKLTHEIAKLFDGQANNGIGLLALNHAMAAMFIGMRQADLQTKGDAAIGAILANAKMMIDILEGVSGALASPSQRN